MEVEGYRHGETCLSLVVVPFFGEDFELGKIYDLSDLSMVLIRAVDTLLSYLIEA